jgi:hypothetical protein
MIPCYRCAAPLADVEVYLHRCPPARAFYGEPIGYYCPACAAGDLYVDPAGYPLTSIPTPPADASCGLCGTPLGAEAVRL